MVSNNPLFQPWTVNRFKATVLNDIWPDVLFFTLVATAVTLVSKLTSHQLVLPGQLLTVLGTVLGLVISFRTSSAYERYQDGRRMWSNIIIASRNLAQMIWIYVPSELPDGKAQPTLRGVIEKKTMINLIQAFSVSLKHFLRGEPGVYYKDLYPLVSFLPRSANTTEPHADADMLPLWRVSDDLTGHDRPGGRADNVRSATDKLDHRHPGHTSSLPSSFVQNGSDTPQDDNKSQASWFRSLKKFPTPSQPPRRNTVDLEKSLADVYCDRQLQPAKMIPKPSICDYIPLLRVFRWLFRVISKHKNPKGDDAAWRKMKKLDIVESNVPLEILLVLSGYARYFMERHSMRDPIVANILSSINMLQENLSELERTRNTPLPFAYQAHLRMSLWFYLFFLPSQLYNPFGYLTIPATAFTAFLLFGFLEIGQEIENPFNYDLNDLDLDRFCYIIHRDLHEITAYTNPEPPTFVYNAWNQPFAPSDRRTAENLTRGAEEYRPQDHHDNLKPGTESIRRTLVKSWREIYDIARPKGS